MAAKKLRLVFDGEHKLWYLVGEAHKIAEVVGDGDGQYPALANPWL